MQQLSIRVGTGWLLLSGAISAQSTSIVSRRASPTAPGECSISSISADGRFTAFQSEYDDLVPGDTNGRKDIFLYDRQTGTTALVSRSSSGVEGNGDSVAPSLSADGRYVVFESLADNLIPGDSNGVRDIFIRDLQTGTTTLVSQSSAGVPGNNQSFAAAISGDGRSVAFVSQASTLVLDDPSGVPDVYLRDLQAGTTEFVSLSTSGIHGDSMSFDPSASFDGRFVAFRSFAANLVPGDSNGRWDVFVRDRQNGTTELWSRSSSGLQGRFDCFDPSISADGRYVAFTSDCPNLHPQDPDTIQDVFVKDRQTGTLTLVSRSSAGVKGNSASFLPAISADGQWVAFMSQATNLVPNDANGEDTDIFVHHVPSGTTELSSRSSQGVQGNDRSLLPAISAEGRFVAWASSATNLVPNDTTGRLDVFLHDRAPPIGAFCFGDGTGAACPCGNDGAPGHGCENSASTSGAILGATGLANLSGDTLALTSAGELPSALSIVLQGNLPIGPASYGDGLRCVGGALKRLYVRNAVGGVVSVPQGGDPSISARSAALGSAISAGASRYYQTYYRDPSGSFCPNPPGNTWNVSSGIEAVWGY